MDVIEGERKRQWRTKAYKLRRNVLTRLRSLGDGALNDIPRLIFLLDLSALKASVIPKIRQ